MKLARQLSPLILLLCAMPALAIEGRFTVRGPVRLSAALVAAGLQMPTYPQGVQWLRPANANSQGAEKRALLRVMKEKHGRGRPESADVLAFLSWWEAQPVTGREYLPETDPRYLDVNPGKDPVLSAGDVVQWVKAPESVAVVGGSGVPCAVDYYPFTPVKAYLQACLGERLPDEVILVRPDGTVVRHGIADWLPGNEPEMAPGVWLLVPVPGLSADEQVLLARSLGTLGPFMGKHDRRPVRLDSFQKDLLPSSGDWGSVGLLQMPTARFRETGSVSASISHVQPYNRISIMFQPLDWLEGGFRYTEIRNRKYGPEDFSGDQTFKDKSIDFKLRLLKESERLPALAIGMRDLGGTSLFSGEYLVASKRHGDWDATLGMGWGNLASRGGFFNPFSYVFTDKFDDRSPSGNTTSDVNSGNYFRGETSLFAGVEWHSQDRQLTLKAEYDANNYEREPLGNRFDVDFPINIGAVYRVNRFIETQLAFERGNSVSVGVTLHGDLSALRAEKTNDLPALPVQSARPDKLAATWPQVAQAIQAQTGSQVLEVRESGNAMTVVMSTPNSTYLAPKIERAGRVMHAVAPAGIDWFNFELQNSGLSATTVSVDRQELIDRATRWQTADEVTRLLTPETPSRQGIAEKELYTQEPGRFGYNFGLDYNQIIGGPEGFILFQLDAVASARYNFDRNTWLFGSARGRIYDTYDDFTFDGRSGLPRVRTDVRRYLTEAPVAVTNLQLSRTFQNDEDSFTMFYAGYLERMFAGFGVEWMYRPQGSPVAVGVDINRARQRDFDGGFGLRDYLVTTGHATFYWDTGFQDLLAVAKIGRYLAGDIGVTFDLSRVFRNGVGMGAYATFTDASREEFGEGGFSKGIYLNVPFDALLNNSTRTGTTLGWSPLTRDGGAVLARSFGLFSLTDTRQPRTFGLMAPQPASR